ncbi:MAG TPA: hypothetical protein VFE55_21145 [Acidimicrobiia bacterium]|nr:hypothetical protein [Acidimicrobiia bacterium]
MARRNLVRSWLAASLLALSGAVAVLVAPAPPAGAVDNNYVDVTLTAKGFIPSIVYARPGDKVRFSLDTSDPTMTRDHTVTLESGRCTSLPNQLCEKSFDDPNDPPIFRFSTADNYPYFDRIARDKYQQEVRGTIVVTDQPPVTTTTTRPTTTTTAAPPAGPTTTTTAGSVHPFVVTGPGPEASTTTTTAPAHLSVVAIPTSAARPADTGAATAGDGGKGGKGKAAAGSATTTTTAAPATTDASILDQASLIPATPLPAAAVSPADAAVVQDVTSTAADLLPSDHGGDGDTRLLLLAVAGLAAFLVGGGAVAWFRRSSRYFPA